MRNAFGCGFGWRVDPGPCPVDDTPHTACTPESVARGIVRTATRAPRSMAATLAALQARASAPVVVEPEPVAPAPAPEAVATFTTKTYKRGVHGRRLRGDRGPV